LSQEAAPTFCRFCCLASAFLVFRNLPLRPSFMLYSPKCVEEKFYEVRGSKLGRLPAGLRHRTGGKRTLGRS
jgi:hypothetical protein